MSANTLRPSGRATNQLREVEIIRNYTKHAEGSVLVKFGDTHVLCTASVEEKVPGFLKGKGQGWVTAEYGMLPRSTGSRMDREAAKGKQSGRTQEIQRLIGRSLRAIIDLEKLGERSIQIDCDGSAGISHLNRLDMGIGFDGLCIHGTGVDDIQVVNIVVRTGRRRLRWIGH